MSKALICPCEDVTTEEIDHAIGKGFCDVESVKRYTGFGTGPCQGKECLRNVALAIARVTGREPGALQPFTSRPPLAPTELKFFVRGREPNTRKP